MSNEGTKKDLFTLLEDRSNTWESLMDLICDVSSLIQNHEEKDWKKHNAIYKLRNDINGLLTDISSLNDEIMDATK